MGFLLEDIYELLARPKAALRKISVCRTVAQAFWIRLGAVLLLSLGMGAGTFSGGSLFMMVFFQLLFSMTFWLLGAAVWHLLAEFMGGRGSVKRLLTATGFISFLQVLVIPFCLLAMTAGDFGMALIGLVNAVIWFWGVCLEIVAIAVIYELSTARAALVWMMPMLALLGVMIAIAFAAGSFLMSAMGGYLLGGV